MTLDQWRSAPFIFVDDLERPQLTDSDLHHYRTVRRIADGAPITISDGRGGWRRATFAAAPLPSGEQHVEPVPAAPSVVGFTPVKGGRPEWVVQKLTELGIDVIVALRTERSVVRWNAERGAKQVERWRVIAREASMQSRRVRIPDVRELATLETFDADRSLGGAAVLAEPGAPALDGRVDRVVLIGPEGGWSDGELAGRPQRSLPGGILRAETAALAAGVILASAADDMAP